MSLNYLPFPALIKL
uniref:Uncharacterized protein n=1 Tax=Arundo donax TaxID=35708 RepID=A0A0A9FH97_ARUDO